MKTLQIISVLFILVATYGKMGAQTTIQTTSPNTATTNTIIVGTSSINNAPSLKIKSSVASVNTNSIQTLNTTQPNAALTATVLSTGSVIVDPESMEFKP